VQVLALVGIVIMNQLEIKQLDLAELEDKCALSFGLLLIIKLELAVDDKS
jgi:hypothetical protein